MIMRCKYIKRKKLNLPYKFVVFLTYISVKQIR